MTATAFLLASHRRLVVGPRDGRPRKRRHTIVGAPFRPGQRVRVVAAVDPWVHDVTGHIGELGTVDYLEYDCGAGQSFPDDPMVGVVLADGAAEEFWREELERAS
ncbi:hypothetical protein WMF30_10575 [Sorangium sp. So ce134]